MITGVSHEDEIRDLFIRLQSGTALSRQQIRDAWPGNIGPYIERLAGKMDRTPTIDFSKFADKRGERLEDESDPYIKHREFCAQFAPHLCAPQLVNTTARATSGKKIAEHYRLWREKVDGVVGIRLDSKRLFDEEQKRQIFDRAEGKCAVCGELVEEGDDEYDHFPIAYRDGGKTTVENGRLVCKRHHPRGRPFSNEEE